MTSYILFKMLRSTQPGRRTRSVRIYLLGFALTLFAGGVLATPSRAQDPALQQAAFEERAGAYFDSLAVHLDLTDAQADLVRPILEESMRQRLDVLEQFRSTNSGRRSLRALRSLRKELERIDRETMDRLDDHLTSDQLARYEAYRDDQRAEMRESMRGRRDRRR